MDDPLPSNVHSILRARRGECDSWQPFAHLEREAVFNGYAKGDRPLPDIYIEPYLCPSDAVRERAGSVLTYVANAGKGGTSVGQRPTNGPFLNRIYNPKAAVLEGHWRDGREYTLIYTENKNALNYDVIGWSGLNSNPNDMTKSPLDSDIIEKSEDYLWSPAFLWHSAPEPSSYINGPLGVCDPDKPDIPPCVLEPGSGRYVGTLCQVPCLRIWSMNARPASDHSGGVNVAFASGRVLFLRENIDYNVLRALMTLFDKESDSPRPDFVVEDQPYL